jgi:hypothetical protein
MAFASFERGDAVGDVGRPAASLGGMHGKAAKLQHNISLRYARRQRDRAHNDAIWGCAACRYMATLRQQLHAMKLSPVLLKIGL